MTTDPRVSRHDVVVAGAGPAGAHVAMRLARAGFSVALLDKKRFPRAKPCGEFMSPECVPLLDELGLKDPVLQHGARPVRAMRLHGHGLRAEGRYEGLRFLEAPFDHGFALRREILDSITLDAARSTPGVTVLEGCAIESLVRSPDGAVLGVETREPDGGTARHLARITVGADGLRSRVARDLGVQRPVPWLDRFALATHFEGTPPMDHAEVHFLEDSYLAVAPVDAGLLSVNLVVNRSALPGGRRELPEFLARHVARAPELAARLSGRDATDRILACGPLAGRTTAQTFDGAALVGDACGYVDPVTGEGLYFAMRGASLLAEHVIPALHKGRVQRTDLRGYVRARRREFGARYAMARLLQRGMRHPIVVRAFLRALGARPGLADLIVSLTGDQVHPKALLDARVWFEALRRVPA